MNISAKIDQLIEHRMSDTILSHLESGRYWNQWCGNIQNNQFTIWKFDLWTGFLYPILKGRIENDRIKLTYTHNPVGRILFILWAFVMPVLLFIDPIKVLLSGKGTFLLFLVVLLIFLGFFLLVYFVNKRITKMVVGEFKQKIES